MLKAAPVTKMILLVAVDKKSQPTFHMARDHISYAMQETLGQCVRLLLMLTKSSGASEQEDFRTNALPNI